MHRRLKQVIYAGIYLIFLSAFGVFIYFIFPHAPASCFDGKRNKGEEGIDCGGVCAQVCLPSDFAPIHAVGNVQVFPISVTDSEVRISVLAEIQNTNKGIAAKEFSYAITLYGSDNVVRGVMNGTSFIYEREIKYIAVPNVVIGGAVFRADISFGEPKWVRAEEFQKPALAVREVRSIDESGEIRVYGVVVNNDIAALPSVVLTAFFYDSSGVVAGISTTELEGLAAHEQRHFTILHPVVPAIVSFRLPRVIAEAARR